MNNEEFEKLIKIYVYDAKETKILRRKFKNSLFFNKKNQNLIDDLFDDSKIEEEKVKYKNPRIGKLYQADIEDYLEIMSRKING
tara:strand:+ start:943 stop:1194 length:252 start_codon:yes stop_codon:yes gene_type:complete